ncbi:AbrB family transcriptional regulator [Paenibacillus thalictri]|uniref:AbrB family transcriptional regulator n=1 Tax=Paenibacillus thalictri TaxID=2527873 RepID=A0A4Q9DXH2_9BACL|nr:AbrB family transcriptional regulator [Paenibacillus thalictri]TBL79931.1 AbrB family transcriptional regulator [Paenibacillus thalictri]
MRLLETVLVTCAGGVLFTLLHIPLGWMLGPLAAAMFWIAYMKRPLVWTVKARDAGLVILGYMMGITFTKDTGRQIAMQLPSMITATLLTVAFSLLTAYWVAKKTKITMASSVIGSIPGGLSQMVVLAEEVKGADETQVAFMQTLRVLAVIFIVPFMAVHGLAEQADGIAAAAPQGSYADWFSQPYSSPLIIAAVLASCWFAVKLRFPTPYMVGPIIAGAVLAVAGAHTPQLPQLPIIIAQWMIGTYMGVTTQLSSLTNWKKLLPYTILSGIGVVLFSLAFAYGLSCLYPVTLLSAFLSTAPGGMTEMGVTAAITHADITMIVAYQMFRILFILFVVPPLLKWGLRRFERA